MVRHSAPQACQTTSKVRLPSMIAITKLYMEFRMRSACSVSTGAKACSSVPKCNSPSMELMPGRMRGARRHRNTFSNALHNQESNIFGSQLPNNVGASLFFKRKIQLTVHRKGDHTLLQGQMQRRRGYFLESVGTGMASMAARPSQRRCRHVVWHPMRPVAIPAELQA